MDPKAIEDFNHLCAYIEYLRGMTGHYPLAVGVTREAYANALSEAESRSMKKGGFVKPVQFYLMGVLIVPAPPAVYIQQKRVF